jgi:hypothetical protein
MHGGLVEGEIARCHLGPLQSGIRPSAIAAAHQLAKLRVLGQVLDRAGQRDRLTRFDQKPVDSVFHQVRYATHRAADDGKTRGERLGEDVPERLRRGRQGE